jgi:aspartate/methionine/tyrosine aminotransferase
MRDFMEELVELCKKHDVTIWADLIYHGLEITPGFSENDIRLSLGIFDDKLGDFT